MGEVSYPSAEVQSVCSTVPPAWAIKWFCFRSCNFYSYKWVLRTPTHPSFSIWRYSLIVAWNRGIAYCIEDNKVISPGQYCQTIYCLYSLFVCRYLGETKWIAFPGHGFWKKSLTSRVLFCHETRRTRVSVSFTNMTFEVADVVVRSLAATHKVPPLFIPTCLRSSKRFPPFYCIDWSSCSLNALWLFYSLGRELSSLLVCCRIKSYIVLIHLSILLPTEYSVLGYSLLG